MAELWAPTLVDVGGCIPTRTVNVNLPGNDDYLGTFTTDTRPTASQAQEKIDDAVNDVLNAVTVTTALEGAAKNAAMWRAAADIELAYPDRNADVNYYRDLNDRAKYQWELLITASETDTTGGTAAAFPVWYSPDSPWWADRTDI